MEPVEIIEAVEERARANGLESLSPDERIVWLISWADFEVNLGGASGYLSNSAGDHLADLPDAFERLGCQNLAQRARQLTVALDGICLVRDQTDRSSAIKDPPERVAHEMMAFEEAIQGGLDDYDSHLDEFIRKTWT